MIKLFEDFKNLNMIDRSFLLGKEILNNASITPNSVIQVNKVSPHRFTTVMEILSQEEVAGVVIRAHNRQLMFVIHGSNTLPLYSRSYDYMVILSDYAANELNDYNYDKVSKTDKEAHVKSEISRIVKKFYDKAPEGTKKKWDILVVYKDENVNDIRKNRKEINTNKVLTPKDTAYPEYIRKLNKNFRERVKNYIDSKRPNITNEDEFKEFLFNNVKINKLKFNGVIYKFFDERLNMTADYSWIKYIPEDNSIGGCLFIGIKFNGIMPEIIDVRHSDYKYDGYKDADRI